MVRSERLSGSLVPRAAKTAPKGGIDLKQEDPYYGDERGGVDDGVILNQS